MSLMESHQAYLDQDSNLDAMAGPSDRLVDLVDLTGLTGEMTWDGLPEGILPLFRHIQQLGYLACRPVHELGEAEGYERNFANPYRWHPEHEGNATSTRSPGAADQVLVDGLLRPHPHGLLELEGRGLLNPSSERGIQLASVPQHIQDDISGIMADISAQFEASRRLREQELEGGGGGGGFTTRIVDVPQPSRADIHLVKDDISDFLADLSARFEASSRRLREQELERGRGFMIRIVDVPRPSRADIPQVNDDISDFLADLSARFEASSRRIREQELERGRGRGFTIRIIDVPRPSRADIHQVEDDISDIMADLSAQFETSSCLREQELEGGGRGGFAIRIVDVPRPSRADIPQDILGL